MFTIAVLMKLVAAVAESTGFFLKQVVATYTIAPWMIITMHCCTRKSFVMCYGCSQGNCTDISSLYSRLCYAHT